MKILITSQGENLDSLFDLRFGRGKYFCIYDDETKKSDFIENKNANAMGGAGTKTSEQIIELGVQKVISGDFGPKAKDLLVKFGVQMVIIKDTDKTIGEIINSLS
jgi:predicted Fe-Mo cluster-binding NifX family protein